MWSIYSYKYLKSFNSLWESINSQILIDFEMWCNAIWDQIPWNMSILKLIELLFKSIESFWSYVRMFHIFWHSKILYSPPLLEVNHVVQLIPFAPLLTSPFFCLNHFNAKLLHVEPYIWTICQIFFKYGVIVSMRISNCLSSVFFHYNSKCFTYYTLNIEIIFKSEYPLKEISIKICQKRSLSHWPLELWKKIQFLKFKWFYFNRSSNIDTFSINVDQFFI